MLDNQKEDISKLSVIHDHPENLGGSWGLPSSVQHSVASQYKFD